MFQYQNQTLFCEQVSLTALAAQCGTPAYVYSQQDLAQRVRDYAPNEAKRLVCFAVKANGNQHLLRLLGDWGMGADVTSGGELFLAQQAGIAPHKIIFSGVGKTAVEIEAAIQAHIKALHIESEMEWQLVAALAERQQTAVAIAIRVNPDIPVATHAYISTGQAAHKFGMSPETAVALYQQSVAHPWLRPVGIAAHLGSQLITLSPTLDSARFLIQLADRLQASGCRLRYVDVGGGLGIDYTNEPVPEIAAWATAVAHLVNTAGYEVVMEPGRSVVGRSGILLTQVLFTKQAGDKQFVIVDAAMNDLLRPTLYGAAHAVQPVQQSSAPPLRVDVVGPVCESGDWLAKDVALPPLRPGDLLAIRHAGAYGFAMGSNYNGRLRPPELLINGDTSRLIRPRQTLTDLLA